LGIDQRQLADLAGVSLPTVQRMEAASGEVRGTVDKLMRVIRALEGAGIEILGDHAPSAGAGRGVRLRAAGAAAGSGAAAAGDPPALQRHE
jgi:transcriptional regulator with XRE-family HTH domain